MMSLKCHRFPGKKVECWPTHLHSHASSIPDEGVIDYELLAS